MVTSSSNSWDSPPLPQRPTGVKTSGASGREIHHQSRQSIIDLHLISSGARHQSVGSSSSRSSHQTCHHQPDISHHFGRSSVGSYTQKALFFLSRHSIGHHLETSKYFSNIFVQFQTLITHINYITVRKIWLKTKIITKNMWSHVSYLY